MLIPRIARIGGRARLTYNLEVVKLGVFHSGDPSTAPGTSGQVWCSPTADGHLGADRPQLANSIFDYEGAWYSNDRG